MYASIAERRKLIFPSDWDLSEIKALSGTGHRGAEVVQAVYDAGRPVPKEDRDTKPELTKAFPSMASILEEMQTIRCIEHDGHRKFITPFVGAQVDICDAFGFEIPEGCRPTYTSRKSTKGKRGRPAKPLTETS